MVTLLSPVVLKPRPYMFIQQDHQFSYDDSLMDVRLTNVITVLFSSVEPTKEEQERALVQSGGKYVLKARAMSNTTPPDIDVINKYVKMQTLLGITVKLAEVINRKLQRIVYQIYCDHNPDVIDKKKKEKEIRSKSFTELMKLFFKFLEKFHEFKIHEKYSELKKLREYKDLMRRFIDDRNIYTHGHLKVTYGENKFVLEYDIRHEGKAEYAYIETQVLTSYNKAFEVLSELLQDFTNQYAKENIANQAHKLREIFAR